MIRAAKRVLRATTGRADALFEWISIGGKGFGQPSHSILESVAKIATGDSHGSEEIIDTSILDPVAATCFFWGLNSSVRKELMHRQLGDSVLMGITARDTLKHDRPEC